MDDLISRQALLDAFGLSEKTRKYGGDHSGYDTLMLYEIQDVVENIPSAEPQIVRVNPELSKEEFERLAKEIKDSPLVLLPSAEPQERKIEKALRLLLEWAIECDFGYDNIPEEYEKYKDDIEGMSYMDGLIYIARMEADNDSN